MGKGFGIQEIKRITITDSKEGGKEETESLIEIGKQKLEAKQSTAGDVSVGQPVFGQKELRELIKSTIQETSAAIASQKDEELKQLKESLEQQRIDQEKKLLNQIETLSTQFQVTKKELEESKKALNNIDGLFQLTGNSKPVNFPNINTQTTHDSDKMDGLFGEFLQVYESIPKFRKVTEAGGEFVDFQKTKLDEFVRNSGSASPRNPLLMSLTEWGKKQGWFQGRGSVPVQNAATTATDLPGGFLPLLSAFARLTHRPGHIFWQFPITAFDFNAGMGQEIQVPRFGYLTSSTTLADYQLSGTGTYADLVTTGDNLASGVVSLTVEEWGRGKVGATTAMSPVRIPSMVMYLSAYDLLMYLDRNLAQDYARFEDRKIRSLWSATSRIVYNEANEVTVTPANVGAGDNGTFTSAFADSLVAYAMTNQFEPFADGCYIYVHNPFSAKQFKRSLDNRWEAPNEMQLKELTNILNPTVLASEDFSRVSGYLGKYNNIHHFVTNAFGVGAAGTEGVQNVTLGGGSTLTRSGYLAGAYTIGRGQASSFEIRESEISNYQRKRDFTWISQEAFGPLDVDPTGYSDSSAVPQQLRVVQVRTTDVAV